MNLILQHALAYASNGWKIFRLSKTKVPLKGTHGHLDATLDLEQVRVWWDIPQPPNIGLACGNVVAIDLDGPGALESPWGSSLAALAAQHGGLPVTLVQLTRRGMHLIYQCPDGLIIKTRNEPRKAKGADGVDIKGLGGYIVLTPSISKGYEYRFAPFVRPPADMTEWMAEWCMTVGGGKTNGSATCLTGSANLIDRLGTTPEYLKNGHAQRDINRSASIALENVYSAHEEARIRSALAAIPAHGYDEWLRIGLCLYNLNWDRSDGTSIAYELWRDWSSTASDKFAESACEAKWASFGQNSRGEMTLGSLFHMAQAAGWRGQIAETAPAQPQVAGGYVNGTVGAAVLPAALASPWTSPSVAAVVFQDTTDEGHPKATTLNTRLAIVSLKVECRKDVFHEKCYVAGEVVDQWSGDLSDDVLLMLRQLIRKAHGFDPGEKPIRDAAVQLCLANQYDPLLDYLDGLKWDGRARLDTWLVCYLGAEDTPLNRAIGRLVLCAAVRRAYHPGTKFDQIMVLEGVEGKGKSSAIEILAGGADYYSDQSILGHSEREQLEAMSGVWLYEIGEMQGMRRADVDRVKAFASRTVDRARPAYGRFRVDQPRRCIFVATTNDDSYLRSETGNRRFWPVMTGEIDLHNLRRDRDQLWSEAAALESQGMELVLDPQLWGDAAEVQENRLEENPLVEPIVKYLEDSRTPRTDVSTREVLGDNPHMQMEAAQISSLHLQRAGYVLKKLGWIKYRKRAGHGLEWRYKRPTR